MSEFISLCPKCRQRILCDTQYSGKRVACPLCLQEILMPEPPAEPRVAPPDSAPTIGSPAATAPPPGRQGGVSLAAVVVGGVVLVLVAGAAIWFALNRPPAQPVAPATPATPVAVVPVGSMPIPVSPVQPVTARLVTGRPAVPTMVTPGSEVCRAEWTFDQDSGTTAIDVTSTG